MARSSTRGLNRWLRARWGWVTTAACCIIFFLNFGFLLTFSILFVALQDEFGSSATETAWAGSIPFGLCSLFSPLVNAMLPRFGHRFVVAAGVTISAIGIVVTSFMPSLYPMYVTFSLAYGLGLGMMLYGSVNLLLAYFPVHNSTRAVLMPMACSNLGMFTLGPFVYFLITRLGWRFMLRIMGSIILGVSLPACLLTFRPPSTGAIPKDSQEAKYQEVSESRLDSTKDTGSRGERCYELRDDVKTHNVHGHDDANTSALCQGEGSHEYRAEDVIEDVNEIRLEDHHHEEVVEDSGEITQERRGWTLRRFCFVIFCPDILLMAISVLGYGLVNSFVFVQLGNFILSLGFSEEHGAQAAVAMGASIMVGKVLLVLFADHAPFPKLGFFPIASVSGVAVVTILLQVYSPAVMISMTAVFGLTVISITDSLPYSISNHIFGVELGTEALTVIGFFHGSGSILASFFGESVDRTGSYDLSLYACIGAYVLCGLMCALVPVYQRCFVKDRFVMDVTFGWKKTNHKTEKDPDP